MSRTLLSMLVVLFSATIAISDPLEERIGRIESLKCSVLMTFWNSPEALDERAVLQISTYVRGFELAAKVDRAEFQTRFTRSCSKYPTLSIATTMKIALRMLSQ